MTKIVFGKRGLDNPTPRIISAILKWVKRVSLAASALSTVSTHEYIAFSLIALAWLVDEIEPLFGEVQVDKSDIEVKEEK